MATSRAGVRLCVVLTFAVGAIAVLTGVLNITYTPVIAPLEPYVPTLIRRSAGFSGALTGFVMMLGAWGLSRRYRAAWHTTIVLLPLTAMQGLVQSSPASVPLIVLSLVSIPTLLVNRESFTRDLALSPAQIGSGLALVGVQLYGTVGAYSLRDQFSNVDTLLDAFYFTLVTASTVGYGDVTGQTQFARLFTMSLVVLGTASFGVAIGVLLGPLIETRLAERLQRARDRELDVLEDHVVVLGSGSLLDPMIDELTGRVPFAVVTQDQAVIDRLDKRDVLAFDANPGDEETLARINIEAARVAIIATEDDAQDAFAALTVRELAPDVRIVAAVTDQENLSKLRRAGADTVVDPASIGATLLVDAMSQPGTAGAD
jgi:voltage-gated potassium channel